MKERYWKYPLFCFHPKFETKQWTVAASFTSAITNLGLFLFVFSLSVPKCSCADGWEVFDLLSPPLLLFICCLCIYGTFRERPFFLLPYVIVMLIFFVGTLGGSVFIFDALAYIDNILVFDNGTFWNLAQTLSELKYRTEVVTGIVEPLFLDPPDSILKVDLIDDLEGIWKIINMILNNYITVDGGEDIGKLLDAVLRDEVLILLGAVKRVMKIGAILLLIGLAWFFLSSLLVSFAHYKKLRRKKQSCRCFACCCCCQYSETEDIDQDFHKTISHLDEDNMRVNGIKTKRKSNRESIVI